MQIVTTAFVTMLWEVVVCILVCIERGDGSSLLGAMAMARPSWDGWALLLLLAEMAPPQ